LSKNRVAATDVTDGKSNDTTVFWGNGVVSENCSSNVTGYLVRYRGCIDTPRRNVGMFSKHESSSVEVSKHVIGVENASLLISNSRINHSSSAGGVMRTY
jgi:hypothetical protein